MLITVIRWEVWSFIVAAAAILAWRALTGQINTAGLLRTHPNGPLSPTRVQMLLTTFGVAGWYLEKVHAANGLELPEMPTSMLLALAGSQATYLTGKGLTQLDWLQYFRRT